MKSKDVCVGVTYVNRGAGRTRRKVLAIGIEHRPAHWFSGGQSPPPNEPGVLFEQKGKQYSLYLSSFAAWAKGPIECDHPFKCFVRPVGHQCLVSTGIHDGLTFGTGKLDAFGYWEFPCPECARAHEAQFPKDGFCWPFAKEKREEEVETIVRTLEDVHNQRRMQGCCFDCGRRYGDEYGFPDFVVPNDVWAKIAPLNDEGGLLCPCCICRRLHLAGIQTVGRFTSGALRNDE